jgi:lipid-binding SYLF domain-containing protein
MNKESTLLKRIKTVKVEQPQKSVIDNLLSYSKSIEIITSQFGCSFIVSNN